MGSDPFSVDAMATAWLQMQNQFLEAQRKIWDPSAIDRDKAGLGESSAEPWAAARDLAEQWLEKAVPARTETEEETGIVRATLRRMLDPGEMLGAGGDDVSRTIQALVGGVAESAAGVELDGLRATQEWLSLQAANGEYRLIIAQAWSRAFARFLEGTARDKVPERAGDTTVLKRWLEIADAEMIATQRSDAFLSAQRKLLRAASDFRLRERALFEHWCEARSIPTRTEVDELHAAVQQLKRDLRSLTRAMAGPDGSSAASGGTFG